jgi:hypothetical protein
LDEIAIEAASGFRTMKQTNSHSCVDSMRSASKSGKLQSPEQGRSNVYYQVVISTAQEIEFLSRLIFLKHKL